MNNETDIAEVWEKNLKHLQSGGFGDINKPETLALYWLAQTKAGYPGASDNSKYFASLIQPKCQYCHEDAEGYSTQFGAFWVRYSVHEGWLLHAGKCKPVPIEYCPKCGRRLEK